MKHFTLLLLLICISLFVDASEHIDDIATSQLSLATAEQLWRQKNRELHLAHDQINAADADRKTATQRPNPQVSLNTTSIESGQPAWIKQADSVLRVDQTIERGDKRALRIRNADLLLDAAHADYADSQRQGRIALYQAYYDLLLAQERLQIAGDNADLFAQTLHAAQLRLKAGDIANADVARLQVDALRADNDVRQAQIDMQQAQLTLAYQIGAEGDALSLHASDHWPTPQPAQTFYATDNAALETRPDIRAATQRVRAAEIAMEQAQALRTRDITVGLQVEHNGQNRPLNTVGVGISVPLLTGYEYQGEIERARANLTTAQDALDQTRAQALADIVKARGAVAAAAAQIARFDSDLLAAAQSALDAAEFGYRHGASGVMDLLDARRTYKAVLFDAASARANYAKALAAWRYATNVGDFGDTR